MTGVYLLLGSNLGNRMDHLTAAKRELESRAGPIIASSSIYNTAAWDLQDAPDFLNQVVSIHTTLNPFALLYQSLSIEIATGRQYDPKEQSRHLDIDILYFHKQVIHTPFLRLPHPRIIERRFVLEPLCEIAPELIHPVSLLSNRELLRLCRDPSKVHRLALK